MKILTVVESTFKTSEAFPVAVTVTLTFNSYLVDSREGIMIPTFKIRTSEWDFDKVSTYLQCNLRNGYLTKATRIVFSATTDVLTVPQTGSLGKCCRCSGGSCGGGSSGGGRCGDDRCGGRGSCGDRSYGGVFVHPETRTRRI